MDDKNKALLLLEYLNQLIRLNEQKYDVHNSVDSVRVALDKILLK